jgi:membrane protease subunit HflK
MTNGRSDFDQEQLLRAARDFWDRLKGSRRIIVGAAGVGLVLVALVGSYYQVEPDEVGLVTRFGRFVRTTNPGPHGKIPFGIEQVQKVPVQRQLKHEFGFRTVHADVDSTFRKDEKTAAESLMLTGDLNVATVEWIVQYKISDPYKYLFRLRDVEQTFRLMAEASMRTVVGDHSVTELLTVGREAIAAKAKELLAELCKRYDNGISVQQLVLQDVDPPESVKPSFNEVNQAIQERERAINEAWAEYNQEIPRARGLAEQKIEASEGYAVDRVNRAKGDAERFVALQAEYRKAPEVTRTRLYLETMSAVLPAAGKKLIFDDKAKGILPLFPLGGEQGATKEAP